VEKERGYDVAVLSAVGDVLGYPLMTLHKLRQTVGRGGLIILDDAYSLENTEHSFTKADWYCAFTMRSRRTGEAGGGPGYDCRNQCI
jgi:hypothetical protein